MGMGGVSMPRVGKRSGKNECSEKLNSLWLNMILRLD